MPSILPRVLITGAGGLVGQALVRHLSGWPDCDLLATGLDAEPRMAARSGGYSPLDVRDGDAMEDVFLDFGPTTVVHCAAISKVETCENDREGAWEVNVDATADLAARCHRHGARLVLLSTDFLFDGAAGPYAEDAPPRPINYYGRTKLAAENAVRASRLRRWAIVRTSLVFGHGERLQRKNLATLVTSTLQGGGSLQAACDQWRTPTYAEDLADGIGRLLRFGKDGVFHLSGRESMTALEFARRAAGAFGLDPTRIEPATTEAIHPGYPRPLRAGLVVLRAQAELGFRPRSVDDALAHMANRQPVSA